MAILPTDIRILFTNYDIIAYFLNLASCSEHFISIKHRILATFNINKTNQFERLYNVTHLISKFCCEYKRCDKLYIIHDILDCFPQTMNNYKFNFDFDRISA
jgi:hypothetical protein